MKRIIYFALCSIVFFIACKPETAPEQEETLRPAEKWRRDSISRAEQRVKTDSLKSLNPLLILPPDSEYTGEYNDKYPDGITKFKGFFRLGKRHGQWMSFYPNGLAWSEMHYDKGLRQGPNITYFTTGKPRYEGFYKNDMQDSVWTFYDSLGVALKRVTYKKGHVVKEVDIKK